MNKRTIIIVIISLLAGCLLFVFLNPSGTSGPTRQQQSKNETQDTELDMAPSPASSPGAYVDYNQQAVNEALGQKVLFFHAPWCPQCRSIESGIDSQGVPAGITIIKVDYDTNQALRQKYGVTLQTTFVKINDKGEFVSKYVAYDEPTFDAVKRNYL